MDDREHDDSSGADDFHIEVVDLRGSTDAGGSRSAPSATSPIEARLTPRERLARVGMMALAGLLAVAVVWNATVAVRERAAGPVSTFPTSSGPIYLLPNPPGVVVSLDGHALSIAPSRDGLRTLRLALGRHTLDWRSHLFPFQPLHCTVSQPRAPTDTCPLVRRGSLPESFADPFGDVIGLHASLAALSPGDAAQLTAAIQQALDGIRSTTDVQAGEHYLAIRFDGSIAPTVAKQPLRATLSYDLFPDDGYPEPCIPSASIPCRFPGQFCAELCTVAQPPPALTDGGRTWLAAALVRATWTYATSSGQTLSASGESIGAQLAVLRIAWDAAGWHAAPVLGHTPGLDVADDLVCDSSRVAIAGTSWSFMLSNPPPSAEVQLASDATPADGCVVVLTHGEQAVFLERVGVLLAANENARNPNDNLPEANAHEQALARQLMAQLSP